jgi:23S rRNA U2552 (ribose-2'-O)-methylase RlmE/FtsJ
MSRFQELGLALAKNEISKLDKQIKDNKLQAELSNQPLEMEKTQVKLVENDIKHQQTVEKLKKDIAKQAMRAQERVQGNVAIGGNMLDTVVPDVEPEAEGMPMVDQLAATPLT